ncbi:lysophospholipid acyltransferase family protein [Aeromonas simiae]|uniref:lysophospholipid acyltransferase family protein n=1 Tax=Aeromonas simiae TaxID=218936 RepID=UPI0038CF9759
MFSVDALLSEHFPTAPLPNLLRPLLRHLLHEDEFQRFAADYPHLRGMDFVEQALSHLEFDVRVSEAQLENLPSRGRVIVVANHPIGSLDGLALLRLLGRLRPDVKIVANRLLWAIPPLRPLLLPVDNLGGKTPREALRAMGEHLEQEGALIIFPAGEVSRLGPKGVRDGQWSSGFIKLARRTRAPLVPLHLAGRNSPRFYLSSWLSRPLSGLLLVDEMFRQRGRQLTVTVGRRLAPTQLDSLAPALAARLVRSDLYRIGRGKMPRLATESPIALPEERSRLKQAIERCELLGLTPDGQQIRLYRRQGEAHSCVLRELGRLREIAFRAVGEGTGKRRDLDGFDDHYRHLLLWDPAALEVVGAYRFAPVGETLRELGEAGLYGHTLFAFTPAMHGRLEQAVELGRSFIQPAYWGKRGLDYLWYGIGAVLARHPEYRYLYGPVSISGTLPEAARALLVHFFERHFGADEVLARSYRPYPRPQPSPLPAPQYRQALAELKAQLGNLGCAIPPLYKQYADLCEPGGVQFLDFGVDPAFGHCIDGLVWVSLAHLKVSKRQRYITPHQEGAAARL